MGNKSEFDMKKLLTYLFVFLLATGFMYAQELVDTANFRAIYEFSYKTRPNLVKYNKQDRMFLDMGDKVTTFYSRHTQLRDSMACEGLKKGLSPMEIQDSRRGIPRGTDPVYYQWYNEKKSQVSTQYINYGYTFEEPLVMPNWELHEDTIVILDYICLRATTHLFGRDWEAYYAPEIPLSRGPWRLWGLPGLIVRATDADHYFLFEMTHFERLSTATPIVYIHHKKGPKGDYKGNEYKKISRKMYLEYEKAYHEDINAFNYFETGHKAFRPDGSPIPIEKKDYIPIEK